MVDAESGERRRVLLEAVDQAAEAEWAQIVSPARVENLRDKYRLVMDACAATGDCPRVNVCWFAKKLVERRMWELYGRSRGQSRDDFRIPHTTWYEVGRELGYTDPSHDTRSKARDDGGKVPRPRPRKPGAEPEPDHSEENRRYIVAFNQAGDAMHVVAEWLQRHPVEGNVDPEVAVTARTVLEAFAKNVHDLASPQRVVPRNMQCLFLDAIRAVVGSDAGVREFLVRVVKMRTLRAKQKKGARFLTHSEINKFLRRAPADLIFALEPAGTFEAQAMGFHGQACKSCKSWRMLPTNDSPDTLECVKCRKKAPREPYVYCRSCHYRLSPGAKKCPNCGEKGDNSYNAHSLGGGA